MLAASRPTLLGYNHNHFLRKYDLTLSGVEAANNDLNGL